MKDLTVALGLSIDNKRFLVRFQDSFEMEMISIQLTDMTVYSIPDTEEDEVVTIT